MTAHTPPNHSPDPRSISDSQIPFLALCTCTDTHPSLARPNEHAALLPARKGAGPISHSSGPALQLSTAPSLQVRPYIPRSADLAPPFPSSLLANFYSAIPVSFLAPQLRVPREVMGELKVPREVVIPARHPTPAPPWRSTNSPSGPRGWRS